MRATNLCFRSPREPNGPFHQHTELKLKDILYEKRFSKEQKFKHGSIYDIPCARTENRVGPGAYQTIIKKVKPTAVKMKISEIEKFTETPETNFEYVGHSKLLQAGNLPQSTRNGLQVFTDQNAVRVNFNLNLKSPKMYNDQESLQVKVCPKFYANPTLGELQERATTVTSNGRQPNSTSSIGPSNVPMSLRNTSSRFDVSEPILSSNRKTEQNSQGPEIQPLQKQVATQRDVRKNILDQRTLSPMFNRIATDDNQYERIRSNTAMKKRRLTYFHGQGIGTYMPKTNVDVSLKANLIQHNLEKSDKIIKNYMGVKVKGSRSLSQAGFTRIRRQVVKRSVAL